MAVMNALRLSAATIAVAVILAAAAIGSCSSPGPQVSICLVPTLPETAADGGPDPCHCDPPPSLDITTCPCLSGTQQDQDVYLTCMASYREEQDAGEGGPIAGCTGQCWPIPPPEWTPILLWIGIEDDAPLCPDMAPTVVFDGDANGTFALGCTSNASGSCPGLGDVCGPAPADDFRPCVMNVGDLDCVTLGPYPERHLFYQDAAGGPVLPSTFCCTPSPLPTP
jgi:hypothetical protein